MLTSARRGIVYPNPNRSDSSDVPRDIGALVSALEVDVVYGQGLDASKPVSSPATPGMQGRVYYATDTAILWYDFGTGWVALKTLNTDGGITLAGIVNAGTGVASGGTVFQAITTDTTRYAILGRVSAEGQARWGVRVDGLMVWGPGGAVATDTTLARTAAATLTLTGTLLVSNSLSGADVRSTGGFLYFGTAGATDAYIQRPTTTELDIVSTNCFVIGTLQGRAYFLMGNSVGTPRRFTNAWNLTVNPDGGVTTLRVGVSGDTASGNAAALTAAGIWTNGSSAASKENFETIGRHIEHDDVLDLILKLPLHRYNYKAPEHPGKEMEKQLIHHDDHETLSKRIEAIKHMGPTAEDFFGLTGLGLDDKTIAPSDMAGMALAGIQALARRLDALEGGSK